MLGVSWVRELEAKKRVILEGTEAIKARWLAVDDIFILVFERLLLVLLVMLQMVFVDSSGVYFFDLVQHHIDSFRKLF